MTDLATQFAQRLAARDNPPPPPRPSQEPAAIAARVQAWLRTAQRVRHPNSQQHLALMLLALMQSPELTTQQLAEAAGQAERGTAARNVVALNSRGLLDSHYRGRVRYHRLSRAAEDALLLVVAGPAAGQQ